VEEALDLRRRHRARRVHLRVADEVAGREAGERRRLQLGRDLGVRARVGLILGRRTDVVARLGRRDLGVAALGYLLGILARGRLLWRPRGRGGLVRGLLCGRRLLSGCGRLDRRRLGRRERLVGGLRIARLGGILRDGRLLRRRRLIARDGLVGARDRG